MVGFYLCKYLKNNNQTSPSKLTTRRIKHETLRGIHSKISSQHHQANWPTKICFCFLFGL